MYGRDIKKTLLDLDQYFGKPVFPSAHWKEVLSHGFVSFDKLFANLYALGTTATDMVPIANGVDLAIGGSSQKQSKPVPDFATWCIIFDQYAATVLFAYPNHKVELAEYRAWLVAIFTSIWVNSRAIDIDRACRKASADDTTFTLNDAGRTMAISVRFLSAYGVGASGYADGSGRPGISGAGSSQSPRNARKRGSRQLDADVSSDNICRHWNSGKCPDEYCRYLHECSKCGKGH
jgi:hypothetical protein